MVASEQRTGERDPTVQGGSNIRIYIDGLSLLNGKGQKRLRFCGIRAKEVGSSDDRLHRQTQILSHDIAPMLATAQTC